MSVLTRLLDGLAKRYLARRGIRHLSAGMPPVAVFAFDRIGHAINVEGRWKRAELDGAIEFLRARGLVHGDAVDVGANIGNHSIFLADYFANVVSLEPNPRLFELLKVNAQLRKNIHPVNVGASDVSKEMSLAYDTSHWGGGHLWSERPDASRAFTVPVKVQRLDDLAEVADHPVGLLHIDVEGHEMRVLRGAESLIRRSRPAVLFELQPHQSRNGSGEMVEWLRANGYASFFAVRRGRVVPVERFEAVFYPLVIALPSAP